MKLLLIEDDIESAKYLIKGLREHGYVVDHAADGKDGLFMATTEKYGAMIIDRMIPQVDGITIVQTLRASGNETPIILLTALDKVEERVKGLKSGADDYLAKPYSFTELLARLETITRRKTGEKANTKLTCGDLEMDLLTRAVRRGGKDIELQAREFALLEYLMRHSGTVVTRTMLLENVWDYNFDPQTNVIDVHISRLRNKIDKGFEKNMIQTLRGAGYKLVACNMEKNHATTIIVKNDSAVGIVAFICGVISIFFMAPVFVPLTIVLGTVALIKRQFVFGTVGLFCALIGFITSPILLTIVGIMGIAANQADQSKAYQINTQQTQLERLDKPTTSEIYRVDKEEIKIAIEECRNKRLNGELKTYVDSAKCSNPRILAAYEKANYPYMDLVSLFITKRMEVSEKIDSKQLTEAEGNLQIAKLLMQISDLERKRTNP